MQFRSSNARRRVRHLRPGMAVAMLAAAATLGSCTTRYQDLLRDRDAEIRELNGRVAALRAENEDLARQLGEARTQPEVQAQPAAFTGSEALQQELGDQANVGYRNGRLSIGVEDKVTFDSGSTKLKTTAHNVLQRIATVLTHHFQRTTDFCIRFGGEEDHRLVVQQEIACIRPPHR